ncbi:hypothetical protein OTU49_009486 [Cherax quadricarinatus]|uniref:Tyrosine-protein phosphatase non-receptor type 4 n=1 Tax=Cherax quadricarinatus TaxID=27406 RepID=A0AAW0WKL9_CHEQU
MLPSPERAGPPQRPARGVRPARPPPPPAHLYCPPLTDRPRPHQCPPPPPRTACPRPAHSTHGQQFAHGYHFRNGTSTGGGRRAKWCGKAASWAWIPLNAAARVESALNTCWPTPSLHALLACLPCLTSSDTLSETGLADREDVDRGVGVGEEGVGVARPLAPPPAPPSTSSSSASSGESDVGASPSPDHQPGGGSEESAHGLVTIRMKPDEGGKFGFNVKGGADQNLPVLVSRVAPNTPADRCYPRLNEGDQVLLINGRDVSAMTHEQVVNFIRASRECHSGELVLTVKQNVYLAEELEEPAFQYVPEALPTSVSVGVPGSQTAPLHESMLLLSEGLEAGSLVAQFEQMYRRKPGLTVAEARRPENEKKNRYRDISPYDTTRVILTNAVSGDYINASYVNMEIQGSGIINRYIACQGPLAGTCTDFWQMVWEQQSTLVVMLTTVVEQGRVKCHRYWPRLYETVDFGTLQVTCLKEEETTGFAFREFTLINTQNQDERHITHMQYLAWPDHGVPDDSTEFLNFVAQVRQARTGMVEPTIVHCSAGIGRTGVLILMETAQCLIEANEPVYPLDVVRSMRDQRAMMIQTASQFRFVCEAIERVYSEGLVKPLAEYQQR